MTTNEAGLLTPSEVADLLRIRLRTLYTWRSRGEGPPAVHVGGQLRYRREDVDGWLAEHFEGA